MIKYCNSVSLWGNFVNHSLRYLDFKKNYSTNERLKKLIKKNISQEVSVMEMMGLNKVKISGLEVFLYNGGLDKDKKILYIHGGTYIEEASYLQLKFAMKIARKTNSTLVVPRYLLAPVGNCEKAICDIFNLYQLLLEKSKVINFLGDSAGGGFILSFSMYLRDRKIKLPEHVIMLSPWLDITLSNSNIDKLSDIDLICHEEGFRYCGELWRGNIEPKDQLVSPIYGDIKDLPKLTLITGEYEIFKYDIYKLREMLEKENINFNFIEYKKQGHDFGIYPTREARLLISDISNILNGSD